ncbi:MAG: hypothetical protein ACE15F_23310, partial [bacterium]
MALPLYVGKMVEQFDISYKGWVSGKGRSSKWKLIYKPLRYLVWVTGSGEGRRNSNFPPIRY